ncbi:NAD(P)-binding protein [uncultured Roseovarius sp.]|uniref:oxidoreductase n=1 Tax=uncultured Roseovarius sp. TaxID=293344 RepID=UPI002605F14B|nr:NAD(P)-binding protein [uncultured Roseovarius sp.]
MVQSGTIRDKHAALFRPGRIGGYEVPNRLVMPPMTTRSADNDGFVTEDSHAYYRARAEGGVGLITVEMASPEKIGRHRFNELGMYDDRFVPGLSGLVETIHAAGSGASIQLGHGGAHTRETVCGGRPIAPSSIPHPVVEGDLEIVVPAEMNAERIAQCVEAHAKAFERAASAGFDTCEIHAAHGYLLSQFLSPLENQRDDDYGGLFENRARFAREIVRACKAAVPEMPLIFRMNGDDFFFGGMTAAEARQLAVWVAEDGADAIHVTAGHYRSQPSAAIMIPPMAEGPGPFLRFSREIRKLVQVPIIAVGRLGDPDDAARALEDGSADFIALGRSLLADPAWPRKVRQGRPVRACLGCNTCVDEMRAGNRLHCLVNPVSGCERRLGKPNGPVNEKIAVIGAGPAGLSYAALAAARNKVTIFEKYPKAGGAFNWASRAPLFQTVKPVASSFDRYIASLEAMSDEAGVVRHYGLDPFEDRSLLEGFDRIVIATGADYRAGLGPIVRAALSLGLANWPGLSALARRDGVRDWFYHRARRATGKRLAVRLPDGIPYEIIGDAKVAGKSLPAIRSAFEAALKPEIEVQKLASVEGEEARTVAR